VARIRKLSERGRRIGQTLFFAVLLSSVALLSVTFHQDANTPEEPPPREPAPSVARTITDAQATPAPHTDAVGKPGPDLAALSAGVREAIEEDDGGTYGVAVYEPRSRSRLLLNADKTFFAASLGKLPTLLALYRAADRGELDLDERITMLPEDIQSYGTGVLHTYPAGQTMTLRECARYLIRESDNTAWEMLNRRLGVDRVQGELERMGARDTDYWWANTTTPGDVLLMLEKISDPRFTSEEYSREMLSFMTETSFEDRIPAALPEGTRVAHKIGTHAASFGDAALVFEGVRRYFLVVIATGVGEAQAREKIRQIAIASHRTITDPGAPSPAHSLRPPVEPQEALRGQLEDGLDPGVFADETPQGSSFVTSMRSFSP
jgi:beta-lactamase class A